MIAGCRHYEEWGALCQDMTQAEVLCPDCARRVREALEGIWRLHNSADIHEVVAKVIEEVWPDGKD